MTVRNVILSMSLLSSLDWAEFFESVSLVDGVLETTPTYGAMDFATRDGYRHVIEELARGSGRTELAVARAVALHAERAGVGQTREAHEARRHEVGYYLVDQGRVAFERSLGFRPPLARRLLRSFVAAAVPGYLGMITVLTGGLLAAILVHTGASGVGLGRWLAVWLPGARSRPRIWRSPS